MSRRRLVVAAFAVLLALGTVVAANTALAARRLAQARSDAAAATVAAERGDLEAVGAGLEQARAGFEGGGALLGNPAGIAAGWLPVAGRSVRTARALAEAGALSAGAVTATVDHVLALPGGVDALAPRGGRLPIDTVAGLAETLAGARNDAERARAIAERTPSSGLVGPVAAARRTLLDEVDRLHRGLSLGAALADALPDFLGAERPRRYFFAAQNPAELRGTGGFMGAWSIVEIDRGRPDFGPFLTIHDLPNVPADEVEPPDADYAARYARFGGAGAWTSLNLTPDFPSAATAVERLYAHVHGERLDGTIVADPVALERLLAVGEPIEVPELGQIDSGNVVEVLANEAYGRFESNAERKQVLGAVSAAIVTGFLRGGADPVAAARALGGAATGGHLLLHSSHPAVQRSLEAAGVAGEIVDPRGDYLAVVGNNAAANKADFYTERTVAYRVQLGQGGGAGGGVAVRLHNETPTSGLPGHVIGPNTAGLEAGDNLTLLSVYCAPGCEPDDAADRELGRPVMSTAVRLGSGESTDVTWTWRLPEAWEGDGDGGRYTLTFQAQPTIPPTRFTLDVTVPDGMRVTGGSDGMEPGTGRASWDGTASGTMTFEVEFERPLSALQRLRRFLGRPLLGQAWSLQAAMSARTMAPG